MTLWAVLVGACGAEDPGAAAWDRGAPGGLESGADASRRATDGDPEPLAAAEWDPAGGRAPRGDGAVDETSARLASWADVAIDREGLDALRAERAIAASARGIACRAACWSTVELGCAAVGVLCSGTAVVTVGGTTIPCSWAILAACAVSGAGGSFCADLLCPQ